MEHADTQNLPEGHRHFEYTDLFSRSVTIHSGVEIGPSTVSITSGMLHGDGVSGSIFDFTSGPYGIVQLGATHVPG